MTSRRLMTPGAINFHVFLCHDSDTHISPRSETTWQMKRNSCLSNPPGLKEISLRWNSRYGNVSLLIFLFSRNKFLLVMSQRHSKQLLDDTPRSCRIMRENDYNLSDGEEWKECEGKNEKVRSMCFREIVKWNFYEMIRKFFNWKWIWRYFNLEESLNGFGGS